MYWVRRWTDRQTDGRAKTTGSLLGQLHRERQRELDYWNYP